MYAISFDLDTEQLKQQYPNDSWQNAYDDIRKELMPLGFTWQQGSVYFGDENMNAVKCVLAAQVLSKAYPWFKSSVRDIRMLRIEDIRPQPCFINQGFKASLCATIQSPQPVFPLPAPPVRSLMPFFSGSRMASCSAKGGPSFCSCSNCRRRSPLSKGL